VFLALDRDGAERQSAYRTLFRSELDDDALADIRLALSQGQPLGHGRFGDQICAATGIRRTQKRPGRPSGKLDQLVSMDLQSDFGF
jgi:putative transposase